MVRVLVGDDDSVDPGSDMRIDQAEESAEGSVSQIDHDPEPIVFQDEPAASAARFRPGTTASQHHQLARHQVMLSPQTERDNLETWLTPTVVYRPRHRNTLGVSVSA